MVRRMNEVMTRGDKLVLLSVLLLALISMPVAAVLASDRGSAITITGPEGRSVIESDRDVVLEVIGRGGQLRVSVVDGQARVVSSTCPDKLCVKMGPARPGAAVVCAPNGVTVRAGGDSGVDAVSR